MTVAQAGRLAENALGFVPTMFQSISFLAPSFSVVGGMTAAAAYAEGALPLSLLIASIAALIGANTLFQFQRRISSAGGYYTYVAQAVGPGAGALTGWLYILFQGVNPTGTICFFGFVCAEVLATAFGIHAGWVWIPFAVVAILIMWALSYRGIRISIEYSMVASIAEMVIFIILGFVLIFAPHTTNTLATFSPATSPTGWSGLGLGALWGYFIFVGYGGSAPLGEEVRNPHRTLSRAVLTAIVVMAVFYLFMGYAVTVGWGIHRMTAFAALPLPVMTLVQRELGVVWFWIVAVLLVNSVLGSGLAQHNAQVRVLYSLSRDGFVLPSALSATHPRFRTPHVAITFQAVLTLVLVLVFGSLFGPYGGFLFFGALITLGNLAVHILANYALPRYFRRIREFNVVFHGVLPWLATIMFLFPIFFTIYPVPSFPGNLLPWIFVAWILAGVVLYRRLARRRPDIVQAIGARARLVSNASEATVASSAEGS
jgi:amino acid transporter